MGFYDRDYYREQPRNDYYQVRQPESWVLAIIIINVLVFIANMVRGGGEDGEAGFGQINALFMLYGNTLTSPSHWWQFLTYGFAHADAMHILFNMIALYMFGTLVERLYGATEFLIFYLATVVVSGLAWALLHINGITPPMLGASGGVCGIIMLGVLNYPRMLVYMMGIVEMPLWVVGVIFFSIDVLGFIGVGCPGVAYEAHLAGVGFAALYFWQGWRFVSLPTIFSGKYWRERRGRKKFFNPRSYADKYEYNDDDDDEIDAAKQLADAEEARSEEVDTILRKISEKGKDSLTWHERSILKRASKEYQKKHKPK